jgi:AAA domain
MKVTTGKVFKPPCMVVYGQPGVGKSKFAEGAGALFLHAEEIDELSAARLPQIKTFDDFENQLKWVCKEKPKFANIAVDTIDAIEKLLHKKIIELDPKCNGNLAKAMGGYGAGYDYAANEMIRIRDTYLKEIRDDLGMGVIILSHCKKIQSTDVVLGFTHDSYEMTLHQKTQNVWTDWVSAVLFASFVSYKTEDDNSAKQFAIGAGERILYTERRPGFIAKNRYNLPTSMPLNWDEFYAHFKAFYDGQEQSADELSSSIMGLTENVADATLKAKIIKSATDAKGDVAKLKTIKRRTLELTQGA